MNEKRAELYQGIREVRDWNVGEIELRDDAATGLLQLRGEASVVDSPYEVVDAFGPFTETIRAGAFDKTVSESPDVVLLANHQGLALARTTTRQGPGALRLSSTPNLGFEATLNPERSDARDVAAAVKDGTATQASFAFRVTRDSWNADFTERTISEVNLSRGDVSVCNFGANPAAFAVARSMFGVPVDEFDAAFVACRDGVGDSVQRALVERVASVLSTVVKPVEVPQQIRDDYARLYAIGVDIPNLRMTTTLLSPTVSGVGDGHDDAIDDTAEDIAAGGYCPTCGQQVLEGMELSDSGAGAGSDIGGGMGAGGGMQGVGI